LECEVEFFERLCDWKARRAQTLIEPFVIARAELIVDECFEELEIAELRVNGSLMMRFEHRGCMPKPEFAQLLL
jgi:hypothetical protein